MKYFSILCLTILISSCGKIENSNSQDRYLYGTGPTGSAQFVAAVAIFNTKCSECHASFSGYSETDFVNAGLVVAQNLAASPIYYRNQLSTVGPGPQNMPSGGRPAMTASELQTVADWINSITP